jgi:hypothetical protein
LGWIVAIAIEKRIGGGPVVAVAAMARMTEAATG